MAAFRALNTLRKFVACMIGAGAAYSCVNYVIYPYNRELYMTIRQRAESDTFTITRIEEAYNELQSSEVSDSLLKKCLTKEIVDQLKYKKTRLQVSLYDVIRSGTINLNSTIGIFASDFQSYRVFAPLFDKVIEVYHGFGPKDRQPPIDLGEGRGAEFPPLDPNKKYIVSTRIRCSRTVQSFPFNPLLTGDDYLTLEQKLKMAFETFTDPELKGVYHSLMPTSDTTNQLVKEHNLFRECAQLAMKPYDRNGFRITTSDITACNYWPKGRGIFHNEAKTFLMWINEQDHLRIISMQKDGDVGKVLDRLVRGIQALEKEIEFVHDDRLGWMTGCPTNLGSTTRASVRIKLPTVSSRNDFKELCNELKLQVRTESTIDGLIDLSNRQCLGLSQYEAVKQMYDGVKKLIELEQLNAEN